MIRSLLRVLCFGLLLLSIPGLADAAWECDDCDVFRNGVHRQVIPTDDLACVSFEQSQRGPVVLRINFPNREPRYYSRPNAGTNDRICVGRHWVLNSVDMLLCNEQNHAIFNTKDTQAVASKPRDSRANTACLLGEEECGARGFKTLNLAK